jgi:hypothetical protein
MAIGLALREPIPETNTTSQRTTNRTVTTTPKKEVSRRDRIKEIIEDRIQEGEYLNTTLDKVTINDDLGNEEEGYYIALVYLEFDIMNSEKTGNEVMKMYSDDLVSTIANKGVEDISEFVVFWEDEHNDRSLKYAYEYKDGGFYIADVVE